MIRSRPIGPKAPGTPLPALLLAALVAAPAAAQPDAAAGTAIARSLAATCTNCHGSNGVARGNDMPPLAGAPAEATIAKMAAYKAGTLPATVMHQIARGYSDEQIRLLAGYFAAQGRAR